MSSKSARAKDVFDKWFDEERKIPTRGKITKKQEAIIINKMLHEKSPFARLFERKRKEK